MVGAIDGTGRNRKCGGRPVEIVDECRHVVLVRSDAAGTVGALDRDVPFDETITGESAEAGVEIGVRSLTLAEAVKGDDRYTETVAGGVGDAARLAQEVGRNLLCEEGRE